MIKIYHNPRCKKSREGLKYLEDKGLTFEVIDYFKKPFTEKELKEIIEKTGLGVEDLIRKQEDDYKKNFKGKSISKGEWIGILIENPKLLQRPIVVAGNIAVLAHPPENIAKIV
ncbi:MAG: arsenate reductase (glutaredoxin) [Bacteroidales bacterium]|nr:arsenate reductase (glutaredoxin) [Bacteroidales bacterium]